MGHGGSFSTGVVEIKRIYESRTTCGLVGEGSRGMNVVFMLDRFINWPSQTALAVAFAVATVLSIAGVVLAVRKWKWFGRSLGLIGFLIIMGLLIVVHEQTRVEKVSDNIRVTRFRYSERTRLWAVVATTHYRSLPRRSCG